MMIENLPNVLNRIIKFNLNYIFNRGKYPDFIIIGVQKGETSALHRYLSDHPEVEMAPNFIRFRKKPTSINDLNNDNLITKEIHFFDRFKISKKKYRSYFNKNKKIQGECTPRYCTREQYLKRIRNTCPKIKLIINLRNPVDRAFSAYNHFLQEKGVLIKYKGKTISLNEIIEDQINTNYSGCDFIPRGFYDEVIKNIYRYFPKEQVLIINSEELNHKTTSTLNQVTKFLEISDFKDQKWTKYHKRNYQEEIKDSDRKKLANLYKNHNRNLAKLINKKYKGWDY